MADTWCFSCVGTGTPPGDSNSPALDVPVGVSPYILAVLSWADTVHEISVVSDWVHWYTWGFDVEIEVYVIADADYDASTGEVYSTALETAKRCNDVTGSGGIIIEVGGDTTCEIQGSAVLLRRPSYGRLALMNIGVYTATAGVSCEYAVDYATEADFDAEVNTLSTSTQIIVNLVAG